MGNIEKILPSSQTAWNTRFYFGHQKLCMDNNYRLLYEYGEILTRVSIASVMPMLTSVNISPFSYNNIFIIRLDHSNIMDDILISEFAAVIRSKLASCLQNAYM